MKEFLIKKSSIILIVIESIFLGFFAYCSNQFYSISLDMMNEYPFRAVIIQGAGLVCTALLTVIALIWFLVCLKQKKIKEFLVAIVIILVIGLFVMEPIFAIIDVFSTFIFHLIPEHVLEQIVISFQEINVFLSKISLAL